MVKIVEKVKIENWREFITKNSSASIYYTPEWKKILEETFNYKNKYLFLVDDSDNIAGFLPLFYVKSKLFGSRLVCLPFSHICGYIGDEKAKKDVIEKAIELSESLNVKFLEIRSEVSNYHDLFEFANGFYTYLLKLSRNLEDVWKKLDKGSVRWAIKKSIKENVHVESLDDTSILKDFVELNFINKKKIGTLAHPFKFFKNLFREFKNYKKIYVAKYKEEMIAGGIFLYFKNVVLYGYGASSSEYLKLHPNHAIIWKAIEDACNRGFTYFDFGRASRNEVGLREFKKRWGTEEVSLRYSFYPDSSGSLLVKMGTQKSFIQKLGQFSINKMPLCAYKIFSSMLVGKLG